MIDTDTRQLRRRGTGHYTSGAGKVPCDHCGHNVDCSMQQARPLACNQFLPALPFTDETGLRKVANTVRVGVAWTQRLVLGQVVALYNSKKRAIFGHSMVVGMFAGNIHEILAAHAHANHIMLDTSPDTAAERLFDWQRQQYGPQIINDKARLTAIYLLRVRQSPPAPSFDDGYEASRSAEGGAAGPGQDHGDTDRNADHDRGAEGA